LGPGTRVVSKVRAGVLPTSHTDALALQHDIDYLTAGEKFNSDLRAITRSDTSIQGIAMKLGLTTRMVLDAMTHAFPYLPNFHLNGYYTKDDVRSIRAEARPLLEKYGIFDEDIL
jgi:hypothetical protein